jgi:hypothetical protein
MKRVRKAHGCTCASVSKDLLAGIRIYHLAVSYGEVPRPLERANDCSDFLLRELLLEMGGYRAAQCLLRPRLRCFRLKKP